MRNRGALYAGILVVALGLIMLFAQATQGMHVLGLNLGWRLAWPFLILLAGLAFLLPIGIWWERRASLAGLAVPGVIITVNGLILLFQNMTGLWGTWSYLWALEPIAVALGLLALYFMTNRDQGVLVASGIVGGVGVLGFLLSSGAFRILGPLVLILAGVLLAAGALTRRDDRAPNTP